METFDNQKLRAMNEEELQLRAAEILRDLFTMRIKKSTNELSQTHHVRAKRREYARLLTILNEKRRTAAAAK